MKRLRFGAVLHFIIAIFHVGCLFAQDEAFEAIGIREIMRQMVSRNDDMSLIYEKMSRADLLVIVSPVYFYRLSAQLKAVIDCFHNPIRDTFRLKKMALLLVGAATLPELFDSILTQYRLCLNFFKLEDTGRVLVRGVKDKGDIRNADALHEAFHLGLNVQ